MKKVVLYTDGACSGNPGVGGWGAVLIYNGAQKEMSGYEDETTNNRMEITAVVKGLSALKYPCEVEIHSDSAYVVNAFSEGWIYGWKKRGWKKSDGKDVLNRDLWEELDGLCHTHKTSFVKVKGHADDELNNRCDFLATSAVKNRKKEMTT